jgi:catechol 2,3-dioxygenase-like lactoylglutathione lyase family enzyme
MRIAHAILQVADIPRSRTFYTRLGFELIVAADHYCRFIVGEGTTLSIERHDSPIAVGAPTYLEFDTAEALDAEIARLAKAGLSIAEAPNDKRWLWREARLIDPDDHILIYFFAGANKLDPPWRVRP